eukprot:UN29540
MDAWKQNRFIGSLCLDWENPCPEDTYYEDFGCYCTSSDEPTEDGSDCPPDLSLSVNEDDVNGFGHFKVNVDGDDFASGVMVTCEVYGADFTGGHQWYVDLNVDPSFNGSIKMLIENTQV